MPCSQLNQDEALMVWMRTAALPTFRKLYGSLSSPLAAGATVSITILNRYNSYEYNGQKAVVLSTASWLGGYNPFLGVAYLTVGSICVALALLFLLLLFTHPRWAKAQRRRQACTSTRHGIVFVQRGAVTAILPFMVGGCYQSMVLVLVYGRTCILCNV